MFCGLFLVYFCLVGTETTYFCAFLYQQNANNPLIALKMFIFIVLTYSCLSFKVLFLKIFFNLKSGNFYPNWGQ